MEEWIEAWEAFFLACLRGGLWEPKAFEEDEERAGGLGAMTSVIACDVSRGKIWWVGERRCLVLRTGRRHEGNGPHALN